ncbi:sulfurtransferase TusA family protein [Alkalibacterium olivapovliticus]|uniref:TusA-related sulfurtransferase n=1 Tax=Alkalibacterium olivapovliticus TaxID=99907 RepID=A0A2T0WA13_9LACT|nr:sulfurtransferase TusA family protein [Alkalibacterium olivapovliticus]PRY83540.1 TusA-related sulfurtransferase [Alkalibacterium olivapovliticus]
MNADKILDAKGLACPMPIVKTRKEMKTMNTGEILEVQATDKGALKDFQAWAKSSGHELLETNESNDILTFHIKKGE